MTVVINQLMFYTYLLYIYTHIAHLYGLFYIVLEI